MYTHMYTHTHIYINTMNDSTFAFNVTGNSLQVYEDSSTAGNTFQTVKMCLH